MRKVLSVGEIRVNAEKLVSVPIAGEGGKSCVGGMSGCGRWLSLGSFHRNSANSDGLKRRCKSCMYIYQRSNPDIDTRAQRKYSAKVRGRELGVSKAEGSVALGVFRETGEILPPSGDASRALLRDFVEAGRGE